MTTLPSILLFCLLNLHYCRGETLLQVIDESKAPLPHVLVVVKYLDNGAEAGRFLTDEAGRIPVLNLRSGLYRFILTCPYGICKTTIFEMLGSQISDTLTLEVPLKTTDGYGELVGAPRVELSILLPGHEPYSKADVLIRNVDATRERWYAADDKGHVGIDLLSEPTVAVIVYQETVLRFSLSRHCSDQSTKTHTDLECHSVRSGPIVLEVQ